jgi:hypothetical protein
MGGGDDVLANHVEETPIMTEINSGGASGKILI